MYKITFFVKQFRNKSSIRPQGSYFVYIFEETVDKAKEKLLTILPENYDYEIEIDKVEELPKNNPEEVN